MVEKVSEGPMSINEVVGWWKAVFENGGLKELVKSEPPEGIEVENTFNFTGIG